MLASCVVDLRARLLLCDLRVAFACYYEWLLEGVCNWMGLLVAITACHKLKVSV